MIEYEGCSPESLRRQWGVARVEVLESVASTQDVAHAIAAGGDSSDALVIARVQTGGRGRSGKRWQSGERDVVFSYTTRSISVEALGAFPLRVGLSLAAALDHVGDAPMTLKWPNDVYCGEGKVAGILVEARWRGSALDWVTVGVGVNVGSAERVPGAASLPAAASRLTVAAAAVCAVRTAASAVGPLSEAELRAFAARDRAIHRRCTSPRAGVVAGVDPRGALLIDTSGDGRVAVASGSLILEEVA